MREALVLLFVAGLQFMAPTRAAASDVDPVGESLPAAAAAAEAEAFA
jgi:hypothetical protein